MLHSSFTVSSIPDDEPLAYGISKRDMAEESRRICAEHLAAGNFICYRDISVSEHIIRENPDGSREAVRTDEQGEIHVIGTLLPSLRPRSSPATSAPPASSASVAGPP